MSGKGDTPRPLSVTPETYAANYARIRWTETDPRETMRQENLRIAKGVINSAPPSAWTPCHYLPDCKDSNA